MQKVFLVILAVSCLALVISGQSCGIQGATETTLLLDAHTESTLGSVLLARFQLVDVVSTSAISSPHYKYIDAFRYANGVYEFKSAAIFPNFVKTERSPAIQRSVNFNCVDGTRTQYTFILPVTDENDNEPKFNAVNSVNVTLPWGEAPFVVPTGIVVSDSDVEFSNADVYVTSSNRKLAPVVTRLFSGEYPPVYSYRVDFQVEADIPEGEHQTIVTADDGTFSVSKIIKVTVYPSGAPITEPTAAPTTTTEEAIPEPEPTIAASK